MLTRSTWLCDSKAHGLAKFVRFSLVTMILVVLEFNIIVLFRSGVFQTGTSTMTRQGRGFLHIADATGGKGCRECLFGAAPHQEHDLRGR